MRDLAAVVAKPDAEAAIAALRTEGVYDDTRRVRERDAETVELPITAAPTAATVRDVVRQVTPEPRRRGLDERLRARGWTDAELARAPGSWAVVGDVVLVSFDEACPRRGEVGEALLDLHGADTVLARRGIDGEHREPDVAVVAGSGDTETVHAEHGTRYALDLARVMFSPGNQAERTRMGAVVSSGERVLDMFAGIGYFALPMARAGARVTAVERNPAAYRYLVENAVLNGVEERLDPVIGDCRDVEVASPVDRVVMGHFEAHDYLDAALVALTPGGRLHLHAVVPERRLPERPVGRLTAAAAARGRDVEVLACRRVKSYGEGVWHVVVDARVD